MIAIIYALLLAGCGWAAFRLLQLRAEPGWGWIWHGAAAVWALTTAEITMRFVGAVMAATAG